MIVTTKKYKIPLSLYIRLGLQNILRLQWWLIPCLVLLMSGRFWVASSWFVLGALLFLVGYLLFWSIQLYGLTQLLENRPMFERVTYEITSQHVIMKFNTKQGMPMPWAMIIKAYKGKEHFILILSKVQFCYLPFKIFHGENEIKFLTMLLQRKGFLKHKPK